MNDFERFYASFGEMILRWNQAESEMKGILIGLSGADAQAGWILVAELGALALEQSVKSAKILAPDSIQPYIEHLVAWFSRLRDYRNYYVHGLQAMVLGGEAGILAQIKARNGLAMYQDTLSADQLSSLTDNLIDFTSFAKNVGHHLAASRPTEDPYDWQLRPLDEMPPLPAKLQKRREDSWLRQPEHEE